jgi:hypothetical protein
MMLKWLIRRRLAAFERANDYDASYVREMLDIDPRAALKLNKLLPLSFYRRLPFAPWYAAKLVVLLHEDCGPCTQLMVSFAERDGVPPQVIRAVLAGDERSLSAEVALAVRFARAVLAREPELPGLKEEVVARFGRRGHLSLAFAIVSARLIPTLKYAMGHGQACSRVKVAGSVTAVARSVSMKAA